MSLKPPIHIGIHYAERDHLTSKISVVEGDFFTNSDKAITADSMKVAVAYESLTNRLRSYQAEHHALKLPESVQEEFAKLKAQIKNAIVHDHTFDSNEESSIVAAANKILPTQRITKGK